MAAFPKLTSDVIMRYTCRLLWYLVNGIKVSGMPFFFILLSLVSKSIADSNGLDLQSCQTYGTREISNLVGHNAPFGFSLKALARQERRTVLQKSCKCFPYLGLHL